eukprot:TRINITY_DN21846_c0_g1_i4.p1 TRINITY_DN21846_c0_g1~~TRINITY_DN21846_c0_g1_i4.p1  ORF type:complete len:904 (+),score=103.50 TRINITY_DN21846_c0_g1_i4:34-2712(+)
MALSSTRAVIAAAGVIIPPTVQTLLQGRDARVERSAAFDRNIFPEGCLSASFSADFCCDTRVFGPAGNAACWESDEGFSFDRCCGGVAVEWSANIGREEAAVADTGLGAASAATLAPPSATGSASGLAAADVADDGNGADTEASFDGTQLFRHCWRGGFNFFKCCTRSQPGGNPECWDGEDFSFERCCYPPLATPAAFLFEDVDCTRAGGTWEALRGEVSDVCRAVGSGQLQSSAGERAGSVAGWAELLEHGLALAATEHLGSNECPLGRITVRIAVLLLCLAQRSQGRCRMRWAAAAKAMRSSSLRLTEWSATTWPLLECLMYVGSIVTEDDPTCTASVDGSVDWSLILKSSRSAEEIPVTVYDYLQSNWDVGFVWGGPCQGGQQWVTAMRMNLCARTEIKCWVAGAAYLEWKLRTASASGNELQQWAALAGSWSLPATFIHTLSSVMRHHYAFGFTPSEIRVLSIMPDHTGSEARLCGQKNRPGSTLISLLADNSVPYRHEDRCRATCGWSNGDGKRAWPFYGAFIHREGPACLCAGHSALLGGDVQNCTDKDAVPLRNMPANKGVEQRVREALQLGSSAPVLSQAALSLDQLDRATMVFTTMVFGHMSQYLNDFAARLSLLAIPNVVVFTLDETAHLLCRAAQRAHGSPAVCLRGEGKTALQKYVVVLTYLALGRDVFWFDFDSVWLKNPLPFLRKAQAEESILEEGAVPDVLAAIDFNSRNCAMNAFFWVRSSVATIAWILALMHWIYTRPYAHDQLAFSLLLGVTPLVDADPLPKPPPWAPLDPNVFANAARFSGLGFSSEVEDLVLFHFFDGWNSNMPDEVEQWATPTYKNESLFNVLYGEPAAARAAIAKSKLPPPEEFLDCQYMTSLNLGVSLQKEMSMYVPSG